MRCLLTLDDDICFPALSTNMKTLSGRPFEVRNAFLITKKNMLSRDFAMPLTHNLACPDVEAVLCKLLRKTTGETPAQSPRALSTCETVSVYTADVRAAELTITWPRHKRIAKRYSCFRNANWSLSSRIALLRSHMTANSSKTEGRFNRATSGLRSGVPRRLCSSKISCSQALRCRDCFLLSCFRCRMKPFGGRLPKQV